MAEPALPHIDSLVHEPARLRVLAFLALVERADFMYLLRQTEMSRGNLSVQTSKLEAAGLVDATKELVDGRARTTFSLTAEGREALKQYRKTMLQIMAGFPE